jgi:hypothetical protein
MGMTASGPRNIEHNGAVQIGEAPRLTRRTQSYRVPASPFWIATARAAAGGSAIMARGLLELEP